MIAGAGDVGLSEDGGERDNVVWGIIGGLGVGGLGEVGIAVGEVLEGPARFEVEAENDTFFNELAVLADLDRLPENLLKIFDAVEPLFLCVAWNEASDARREEASELPDCPGTVRENLRRSGALSGTGSPD